MNKKWDTIWINACLMTGEQPDELIPQGALAVKEGKIAWVGSMKALPAEAQAWAEEVHDVKGLCITPGLIDCHTHIIYAGNRAQEFEMRLQGVSYEEIARRGGGIQSTVKETRAASFDHLLKLSEERARALMQTGVTTLEIKSGYGLDWPTERKLLQVATQLQAQLPVTVYKTLLAAHVFPPEYQHNKQAYVDLICEQMIPQVAQEKLADAVDVFCEKIAFDRQQTEKIFQAAKQYGLAIKCHAEQLSDSDGAALAAQYQALSVDHLEHLSLAGVKALAASGTVAVLLPGAYYFLRENKKPPIHLLREYQIPMAIATDCNPGTSPIVSLLLILNMAATLFGLTPMEALQGVTKHAALALGMDKTHGSLQVGKVADLIVWNVTHPVELVYYLGGNPLQKRIKAGKIT